MKPKNISLALYLDTKARLNKARFPHTFTLTRWINQAICDKLDREHPETTGVSHMEDEPLSPSLKAVHTFDPMVERRRLLRVRQGPNFVGPYTLKYKGDTLYFQAEEQHKKKGNGSPGIEALLEDYCIASNAEMSTEEKGRFLAAHAKAEKELAERVEKQRKDQEQEIEELKALRDAPQINPHVAADVKAEAVMKAKHEKWLAEKAEAEMPLVNVAAPTMEDVPTAKLAEDEEDSFWGSYDKIKAMARKI